MGQVRLTNAALEEIRQAVPATHDGAVIRSGVLMVQAAVRLIQNHKEDITRCEERIAQLTKSHLDLAVLIRCLEPPKHWSGK